MISDEYEEGVVCSALPGPPAGLPFGIPVQLMEEEGKYYPQQHTAGNVKGVMYSRINPAVRNKCRPAKERNPGDIFFHLPFEQEP